ncbi:MAG: phosphotransferase [Roseibium sp.]|uniref:choline/ethanolamine kinase family protein n=1 Tax=Roseibium sp. TaxID=1936156 RepID=UPI00262AC44A|nr:phosphotransferase [Roseibium sp.]MCV0429260.1 phosphotransferase [Roseibium sp.]
MLEICGKPRLVTPHSGLTNRVYRLVSGHGEFFLRLPRAETAGMIDRIAEAHNLIWAADLGLALPALFCDPETGVLVTRSVQDVTRPSARLPTRLGDAIGRLHASNAPFQGTLDADAVFLAQRELLAKTSVFWSEMVELEGELKSVQDTASQTGPLNRVPCHGDLSPGNCLGTPDGLWLIDWEYSGMADPAWDLAYAVLEHGFPYQQETEFLEAYCASGAKALCPSFERLETMKSKCDAVSALWALEQVSNGRDKAVFLPFARERRDRALSRLRALN